MFDLLDKAMWSYIIKDIGKELEYLPYALFLGIIVYFVFKIILRKNSKPLYNFYKVIFLVYLFALVHITLFEREPGSRTAISLTLFETREVPEIMHMLSKMYFCLSHMVFYLRFFFVQCVISCYVLR